MSKDMAAWLLGSPRIAWETEFHFMLHPSLVETASKNSHGISLFIRGFNAEYNEKDPEKSFKLYTQGARKLDPLCLCKLHEIYTGGTFFRKEVDIDKAVIYLLLAGLYSQDIDFGDTIMPLKKLKAFLTEFDPHCKLAFHIFNRTDDEAINSVKDFSYSLLLDFQGIESEQQRNDFLHTVESLPLETQKNIIYTLYLNEFRLPWTHLVQRKENLVLKLMENPEIFERFFENYKTLIELALISPKVASKFQVWLDIIVFVLDFAALQTSKKEYYSTLMPLVTKALGTNLFESKDTQCWLRYFLAYCYEKGISVPVNKSKALQLIEKNIAESPDGVKYPLRKAILLRQMGKNSQKHPIIEKFESLYEEKVQRSECTPLFYARAKSFEKFYDNAEEALKYYRKGAAELEMDSFHAPLSFFYTYWGIRCLKRLNKLEQRMNIVKVPEIFLKFKTEEVPLKTKKAPYPRTELLPESKRFFESLEISVVSNRDIITTQRNPDPLLLINKSRYYSEEFEIDDPNVLKENSRAIRKFFSTQNPKLATPDGVYLEEKGRQFSLFFMLPHFDVDLDKALRFDLFPDIKTKIHVASQTALCLIQIHQVRKNSFYGTLKPKKILLDKYFGVTLINTCTEMLAYQVVEPDVYFAPEQFEGRHSQFSDIWAFGRILWELLCDHQVPESQLKEGEAESLGRIEDLIADMMKNEPTERTSLKVVYNTLTDIYNKIPRS